MGMGIWGLVTGIPDPERRTQNPIESFSCTAARAAKEPLTGSSVSSVQRARAQRGSVHTGFRGFRGFSGFRGPGVVRLPSLPGK